MCARQTSITKDAAITEEHDSSSVGPSLGRTVPIIADGRPFLTYKEASRYLLSLTDGAREQAYAQMSRGPDSGSGG